MERVFEARLAALNAEQRKAVEHGEGPLLIIAGPGTGKTEMLALRTAYLVNRRGARPEEVLCLTFTETAANNMRARLSALMGLAGYRVPVHTFHGFASFLMAAYPDYFRGGAEFSPADEIMQAEMLEGIFRDMEHGNPLRAEHEGAFVFLKPARSTISSLKRAGIMPADFKAVLAANAEGCAYANARMSIFEERAGMALMPRLRDFTAHCAAYPGKAVAGYAPLPHIVAASLGIALDRAEESGKAGPIAAWKERHARKDEAGQRVLRDTLYLEKLGALADCYAEYRERMRAASHYDFDDMLLDALVALRGSVTLRHAVRDRYAYALLDEFQDTNDAQMRLAEFLTPNLVAVGDDDQAIYRFQGAELSNILDFTDARAGCAVVSLVRNYRSRQEILDAARSVIVQGEDRLERHREGLAKNLIAEAADAPSGAVRAALFATPEHEASFVAYEVMRLRDRGASLSSIAVIGRRHADLDAVKAAFAQGKIPVSYERELNVLHDPVVREVLALARFASLLGARRRSEAGELLPVILSFPFWNLPRHAAWEVSVRADKAHEPWLMVMRAHGSPAVRAAADSLIALGTMAKRAGAEEALDAIIAVMRPAYWNPERLKADPYGYLSHLSALKALVRAVRAHKPGRFITLAECVALADLHAKNGLPISDTSLFAGAADAVRLLTAHGSKGLEFETAFVVGCEDRVWAGPVRGSLLPFPMNLPIAPPDGGDDDRLRLLYVAMTRAKSALYLASYRNADGGKEAQTARFLRHMPWKNAEEGDAPAAPDPVAPLAAARNGPPYIAEERAMLAQTLADYRLSVTHLNNFLNVMNAGPQVFFEQNLLRFPQAKSASASYGSAMHAAMEALSNGLKESGAMPDADKLIAFFAAALRKERLSDHDEKLCAKRGEKALRAFHDARGGIFSPSDLIELRFKAENIIVSGVPITGAIDRIVISGGSLLEAHDWKTGKASLSWDAADPREKVKLANYRRQLAFYKILIEHAPGFAGKYRMERGVLDYLEPMKDGRFVELPLAIEASETERLAALISAVHKRIMALDFPDISKYSKDAKGITAFEDDLLENKI